jgi:predicted N-acyltransferase
MIVRRGLQFHWRNPGYRDFADFLSGFNHDKRKKVRQERRKLAEAGVTFMRKRGDEITPADWRFFYACYERTYRAHHSTPYLSRAFFQRIGSTLAPHLLLVIGSRGEHPLCAALDVYNADTLWGRYWGTTEFVRGLHFEACYYQAIEFCIEERIGRFEGGAQGVHKLARGCFPWRRTRCTRSAIRLRHRHRRLLRPRACRRRAHARRAGRRQSLSRGCPGACGRARPARRRRLGPVNGP